jgi:GNAT superfamily N-acetyltransferase
MLKKVCSYLLIAFVVSISCAFSALTDGIEIGSQFQKKGSPVYLECRWKCPDHPTILKKSFYIKLFDASRIAKKDDQIVGSIGISNTEMPSCLSIGAIDVYDKYRRKGYATWGIEIFLGIYRHERRASVPFEKFGLSVALRNKAAIRVYEKVGFTVDITRPGSEDWQYMTLPR